MPSSTVLISGPAVVGSSDSNLVLLLCVLASTAIRASVFSFGELSMAFYIFRWHRVCLVDCVDLICNLWSWWEGFGFSSLASLPLGFNCDFISTSGYGSSTGVCSCGCPGGLGSAPVDGQMWRWCGCLGHRGSGSTKYSGGLAARAAGNIVI